MVVMEDIIWLSDKQILTKIGNHIKSSRLSRGATRSSVAESAGVATSTLEKIENGDNFNMLSLIQVLRVLGLLDDLQHLAAEPEISPIAYERFLKGQKTRKRGTKNINL